MNVVSIQQNENQKINYHFQNVVSLHFIESKLKI